MRPDLATHGSGFILSDKAKRVVDKVRFCINDHDMLAKNQRKSDRILFDIPHRIGMEKLRELADENDMTLGELLSILSTAEEETETQSA